MIKIIVSSSFEGCLNERSFIDGVIEFKEVKINRGVERVVERRKDSKRKGSFIENHVMTVYYPPFF